MKGFYLRSTTRPGTYRIAASANVFRFRILLSVIVLVVAISVGDIHGQDPVDLPAPPPLTFLSAAERNRLESTTNVKERTKLALGLMDARLKAAEGFKSQEDFRPMFDQLGYFQALVNNTLVFLTRDKTDNGKILNNLKRLEIGLRGFMPRLESIRRDLPLEYEQYVRNLMKYLRESRTRAVEPLFGNSVLRENEIQ